MKLQALCALLPPLLLCLLPATGQATDEPLARARAARAAALEAEAPRLATTTWIRAEERLRTAEAGEREGHAKSASRNGEAALKLYDEAQLLALKAGLLTGAREQLLALGEARTARLAPRTTARAQALLQAAEATLDADRNQVERAAGLAREATREAQRALALGELLRPAGGPAASAEDIALQWEDALARAAAAAGLEALPPGPVEASAVLARLLDGLHQQLDEQAAALQDKALQASLLEEEIRELDGRLASASSRARDLTERIEASRHAQARYERLAASFAPDQAIVLRQGDTVTLRLVGLGFAPGSTRLLPGARSLLPRLRAVVDLYPGAHFTVEGHTDSSGDSATNQRLSQARAEVLRDYMISEFQLAPGRISALGLGDARPIASNASAQGRQQNRRLELLVTTPAGSP